MNIFLVFLLGFVFVVQAYGQGAYIGRQRVLHKPIKSVYPVHAYPTQVKHKPFIPIHKPVYQPKGIIKPTYPMHHQIIKPIHAKPVYPQPIYPKHTITKPIIPIHKPVHGIHPRPVIPMHRPVHIGRPHVGLGGLGSPVHNVHNVGKSGIVGRHHNPAAANIGHRSAAHLAGKASNIVDAATGGGVSFGDPRANFAALDLAREAARVTSEELALASGAAGPFIGGRRHHLGGHGQFGKPVHRPYPVVY